MRKHHLNIILILIIVIVVIWVNIPSNPGIQIGEFERNLKTVLGLDLQGGMQVLLEADLPSEASVDAQSLQDARQILENRSNGLGVSEVVFQVAGTRRILGEFPGLTKTDEVIAVLKETGQLEFVDMGDAPVPVNTKIKTDSGLSIDQLMTTLEPTTEDPSSLLKTQETIWHTVLTGDQLRSVAVTTGQLNEYLIQIEFKPDGADIFEEYTRNNIGKYLAIVLDKTVISTPVVNSAIPDGK